MLAKGCWRRIGQNLDSRGRKGPALWASGVSESRHWGGGRSYDLPQGGVVALVILSGAEQTEEGTLEIVNVGTKMTGGSKLFRRKFTQALTSQLIWQEGMGSLLLLAAAKQTGLLEMLVTAVMELADLTIPGLNPPNPAVVMRLILTLLFLPVTGLARTWDLRSYTGTMLAVVTARERAYTRRYTQRFLACLSHAGAAQ